MSDELAFVHENPIPDPEPPSSGWRRAARIMGELLAGVVLFGLLMGFLGRWRAPELPVQAPDFHLSDLDGHPVNLSDFAGKTVVLNFWATWCTPCKIEAPTFDAYAKAHPEVPILGIAVDGSAAQLRAAAKQLGIEYPVLIADKATLSAYSVGTLPMTVVVSPEGQIRSSYAGLMLWPHLAWAAR